MKLFVIRVWLLLVTLVVSARAETVAEPSGAEPVKRSEHERMLNGHVFPHAVFVPSPFITTHLTLEQGLIYVRLPVFPITSTQRADVAALALTERLELGVRLVDVIELCAFGGGDVLTGTDVRSVIVTGSSFSYEVGLGAALRLLRSQASGTQLSLRVRAATGSGNLLDIFDLLNAVIARDPETLDAIVDNGISRLVLHDVARRRGAAHVLLAQALSQHAGVQVALGAAYESLRVEFFGVEGDEPIVETENQLSPDLSVAADANLAPAVPFGVALEYSLRRERGQLAGSDDRDWSNLGHLVAFGVHAVHTNFHAAVAAGAVLGLEPIGRATTSGQTVVSDTPAVYYGTFSMGINW